MMLQVYFRKIHKFNFNEKVMRTKMDVKMDWNFLVWNLSNYYDQCLETPLQWKSLVYFGHSNSNIYNVHSNKVSTYDSIDQNPADDGLKKIKKRHA